MVAPRLRSRTFRRRTTHTPGGRHVVHYSRRKPAYAQCGTCGEKLSAVPRAYPSKLQNMSRSAKRPERPYGGVLCTKCMRAVFKRAARLL
ncbi:50S ribosomal protein L34e [Candidatus Woesearchaeota archaeon]|nr:50S ribosomal protein L34e [Candidatus Woesearchaeota archaeon]